MPLFTPCMWPIYRRPFPITVICTNLQFLLATLTYIGIQGVRDNQKQFFWALYTLYLLRVSTKTRILKISTKISREECPKKHRNKWWHLSTSTHHISLRTKSPKSFAEWSWVHSRGFRTAPQRNVMGQSTEMSPLTSMLFWTFLNVLNFLFNILVCLLLR